MIQVPKSLLASIILQFEIKSAERNTGGLGRMDEGIYDLRSAQKDRKYERAAGVDGCRGGSGCGTFRHLQARGCRRNSDAAYENRRAGDAFENIKGHPDASVLIGLLASRKRVGALLGCAPSDLGHLLCRCTQNPIQPVVTDKAARFRRLYIGRRIRILIFMI